MSRSRFAVVVSLVLGALLTIPAHAQFRDDFNGSAIDTQWGFFTGDGTATMDFRANGDGYASILVDATKDRRGIWWALIKRNVAPALDLSRLKDRRYALRAEARIRVSDAPRRVNLSFNTQKTTDFHTNLMEFDIDDTSNWHTISLTVPDLRAEPGDTVNAQLALMDWGLQKYRVDVDYFKVDIVDLKAAGADLGVQVPYRPPVADPASFSVSLPVAADSMIDLNNPDFNFNDWRATEGDGVASVLTVNGSQYIILRWDLSRYAGEQAAGSGLLELTTQSVERIDKEIKDFGGIRVTEIIGGNPAWDQQTVTLESLCKGEPLDRVFNGQMIIDVDPAERRGGRTLATISRPVLQRMLDGKTTGIVIRPLGAVNASVYSMEYQGGKLAPRLYFSIQSSRKRAN